MIIDPGPHTIEYTVDGGRRSRRPFPSSAAVIPKSRSTCRRIASSRSTRRAGRQTPVVDGTDGCAWSQSTPRWSRARRRGRDRDRRVEPHDAVRARSVQRRARDVLQQREGHVRSDGPRADARCAQHGEHGDGDLHRLGRRRCGGIALYLLAPKAASTRDGSKRATSCRRVTPDGAGVVYGGRF